MKTKKSIAFLTVFLLLLCLPCFCFAEQKRFEFVKPENCKIGKNPFKISIDEDKAASGTKTVLQGQDEKTNNVKIASNFEEGKWYTQRDGLFKIFVPNKLQWFEYPNKVMIADSGKKKGIDINFAKLAKGFNSDLFMQMNKNTIKSLSGSILVEKKITFKGMEGYRLEYSLPSWGDDRPFTSFTVSCKGYMYTAAFGGVDKEERVKQEAIVDTWEF